MHVMSIVLRIVGNEELGILPILNDLCGLFLCIN